VLRPRYPQHATPNPHFRCFNPFISLFCNVHVSLPYIVLYSTQMLSLCVFQLEAEGFTHDSFILIESFLCQCDATSYFTFASAVLDHSRSFKINDFHVTWKPISHFLLVVNSNFKPYFSPFPRYGHLYLKTFRWKLRPNSCKQRHDYYWQPHQRSIRWYHRRLPTTYRLATIHPWQADDRRTTTVPTTVPIARLLHKYDRLKTVVSILEK